MARRSDSKLTHCRFVFLVEILSLFVVSFSQLIAVNDKELIIACFTLWFLYYVDIWCEYIRFYIKLFVLSFSLFSSLLFITYHMCLIFLSLSFQKYFRFDNSYLDYMLIPFRKRMEGGHVINHS